MISKIGAITLVAILLSAIFVVSAAINMLTITNIGNLNAQAGVESDTANLDWGTVDPSSEVNRTVNFRRSGNVDVTLSINVGNWTPTEAAEYMMVSWNYTGESVSTIWVPVMFTLEVFANATTASFSTFTFDIYVFAV